LLHIEHILEEIIFPLFCLTPGARHKFFPYRIYLFIYLFSPPPFWQPVPSKKAERRENHFFFKEFQTKQKKNPPFG